jgi:ribosomal protein S18 acetylase RimI-like enzyme
MTSLQLRAANVTDAEEIAQLHANSWRQHYRGAYSDSYLDGGVVADRLAVWHARLSAPAATPAETLTVRADDDGSLVGFVHVVFDESEQWGSLVDNLHVTYERKRSGIGRVLLGHAAVAIATHAVSPSMYLWVHAQNTAAQAFYRAAGGQRVETAKVGMPGGVPEWLNGSPDKFRIGWPDVRQPLFTPELKHLSMGRIPD